MKVYWMAVYGKSQTSVCAFQGKNAKRDAQRFVKRLGGRVFRTVMPDNPQSNGQQ